MINEKKEDDQNDKNINLPSTIWLCEIKEKMNEGVYSEIYSGISKYIQCKV